MKMKMYRTGKSSINIDVVDVEKVTPKSVWVFFKSNDVRLYRRYGDYEQYFDTFNEAKEFLLKRENELLTKHLKALRKHSENLENLQKLEEPNDLQEYPF